MDGAWCQTRAYASGLAPAIILSDRALVEDRNGVLDLGAPVLDLVLGGLLGRGLAGAGAVLALDLAVGVNALGASFRLGAEQEPRCSP